MTNETKLLIKLWFFWITFMIIAIIAGTVLGNMIVSYFSKG